MPSLGFVVITVGVAFFIAMTWAVRFHFNSKFKPVPFVAIAIVSVANLVVLVRSLWRGARADELLVVALLLMLAGAGLFAAALASSPTTSLKLIFDRSQPQQLLEAGVYRYIRHPFYASYLLFWLGCAVATLHPANIALFMVIALSLVIGARAEEKGFARSPLSAQYEAYRARTGMFWPRLWPSRA